MALVHLADGADLAGFRRAIRRLVAAGAAPEDVIWRSGEDTDLFGAGSADFVGTDAADFVDGGEAGPAPPLALPRVVGAAVEAVVCHRDPERYALLHRLIWRVLHGERTVLEARSDPLVHRLAGMQQAIRRDIHKMHAFLRFRRVTAESGERFVAWFEPEHFILEAVADFFADRFPGFAWSILTPVGSLHWDGAALDFGPPGTRGAAMPDDSVETAWRAYYEATFNPARLNPTMMRSEMPKKYWRNLPETQAIPHLIRTAPSRVTAMLEKEAAMPLKRNPDKAVAALPDQAPKSLAELNRIIAASEPLVPGATRAVLGEGPVGAALAFVGEQPGDQEDLQGRPFVGPAGQLLDRAMAEAGIDRTEAYVTNAVKHFKFEQRGKRRIHQKPTAGEVRHYRWWLMRELDFVHPRLVVALGATAVLALAGKALPIARCRGEARLEGRPGFITVHPSYLLRLPDEDARHATYAAFLDDLRHVRAILERRPAS